MQYTAIIPTAIHKQEWLKRTLFGLLNQTITPAKVLIGVDTKHDDPITNELRLLVGKNIEVHVFDPPCEWKRQHEIINKMVGLVDPEMPVLIMDDDYWIEETDLIERMIERFDPHLCLTYLETYAQFFTEMPPNMPKKDGRIIDYHVLGVRHQFSTKEEDGHHNPFCGHPKIITAKDFLEVGGFDTHNFKHYWWSDTDLFLRIKEKCRIEPVPGKAIHLHHPRRNYKAFVDQNQKVLDSFHPGYIQEIESKRAALTALKIQRKMNAL